MSEDFEVLGTNAAALFTLKVHRGEGMALLAMNWREGQPPGDFVGFGIEYKEPDVDRYWALQNRLGFPGPGGAVDPNQNSTLRAPIQKFRWVHFPFHADLPGAFSYRVTPVFMNSGGVLSYGDAQEVEIELSRETYPGELNRRVRLHQHVLARLLCAGEQRGRRSRPKRDPAVRRRLRQLLGSRHTQRVRCNPLGRTDTPRPGRNRRPGRVLAALAGQRTTRRCRRRHQ